MGAIDSQSVKKGMFVSEETGIDGNKKINGRKRHIITDSLGLPITISVTAANVYDGNEGKNLIKNIQNVSSRLTLIRADNTYKGSFVEDAKTLGYEVEFGRGCPIKNQKVPKDLCLKKVAGRLKEPSLGLTLSEDCLKIMKKQKNLRSHL
jgi:hypothetical protein